MFLSPETHHRIESFLRDYLHEENLKLPRISIYNGRWTRWLTSAFHISAITFGRWVFVAPKMVTRDGRGRLTVPAKLIAHEAMHVIQYARAGFVRFLCSYLREYLRALRKGRGWSKAARHAAYLAIKQEQEAYAAESAFDVWRLQEKMREVKTSSPRDDEEDRERE
jgi:hypothetical protein